MKKLILIFFVCLLQYVNAKTYYVSSSSGNDNNSGTDPSTAWQSLNKLNSFSGLKAGDNVLLKRGDIFYGQITATAAGNLRNPITYGAYGTGEKPLITGFKEITTWRNLGSNIWESADPVTPLTSLNMVVINGVNTAMGRYPNTGYITYESHNGNTSITSKSLTSTINWTGASIAMKKQRWWIEVGTITGQSGHTIYFTDPKRYQPYDGFGFFIQNDPRTLDVQNEWYFNPTTKKLRIYSTSMPANVQVPTVDYLFLNPNSINYNYIVVDNLALTGSNNRMINLNSAGNSTVTNCDLSFCGSTAIFVDGINSHIEGNTIQDACVNGIYVRKDDAIIRNNHINKVYLIPGSPLADDDVMGIYVVSPNGLIEGNILDSLGQNGISFYGDSSIARRNFVNHYCLTLEDGCGVGTHWGYVGQQLTENIILNGIGNNEGTNDPTNHVMQGIYLDDLTKNIRVIGNTVATSRGVGIIVHRAKNITMIGNTFYDCGIKGAWSKGQIMYQNTSDAVSTGDTIKNNIFFAKNPDQMLVFYYTNSTNRADLPAMFNFLDSNYYVRGINTSGAFEKSIGGTANFIDFSGWQAATGRDAHSISYSVDTTGLKFVYNASNSDSVIALGANYKDVAGYNYTNINLQPFTSAVLAYHSPLAIADPTVSVYDNQADLTVNNTTIYSTAYLANGHTITSYSECNIRWKRNNK